MFKAHERSRACLDDGVLLSIARGEISEPTLSHFLAHLEICLACCQRSIAFDHPSPLLTLIKKVPRKAFALELDLSWKDKILALAPQLGRPFLESSDHPGRPEGKQRFGPFVIEDILGEGRTAVVYKAFDPEVRRHVALKVLRPEVAARPGMTQNFLDEARALAGVRDPHLVVLHSYGRDPQPHITMELLEGRTMVRALADGPIEPRQALKIIRDIASGLEALHLAGINHRDIKPANIRFKTLKGQEQAVLLDLGLSGEGNKKAGTPGYIAPEILSGNSPSPACDMFSLGVVLRVLALGGDSGDIVEGTPPPSLAPFIDALMDSRPERRPTANQLIQKIDQSLATAKPSRLPLILCAVLIAVLIGVFGYSFFRPGRPYVAWANPFSVNRDSQEPDQEVSGKGPVPSGVVLIPPDRLLGPTGTRNNKDIFFLGTDGLIVRGKTGYRLLFTWLDGQEKEKDLEFPFFPYRIAVQYPLLALAGTKEGKSHIEIFDVSGNAPKSVFALPLQNRSLFMLEWLPGKPGLLGVGHGREVHLIEAKNGIVQLKGKPIDIGNELTSHNPVNGIWQPNLMSITTFMPPGGVAGTEITGEPGQPKLLFSFRPLQKTAQARLDWHPSGNRFVATNTEGEASLFSMDLVVAPPIFPHPKMISYLDFDFSISDSKWVDDSRVALLLSGETPTAIRIYDPVEWKSPPSLLDPGPSRLLAIATVAQKGTVAALAQDGSVRVWHLAK